MKRYTMIPPISVLLLTVLVAMSGCSTPQSAAAAPADKESVEAQWAAATMVLREQGGVSAFEDADILCYVESVDGRDLKVYTIYRTIDEAGELQPQIMFSGEDDPAGVVFVVNDALVDVLHVEQNHHEVDAASGLPDDIVPGAIISVWGEYEESELFVAERIVVWITEGAL